MRTDDYLRERPTAGPFRNHDRLEEIATALVSVDAVTPDKAVAIKHLADSLSKKWGVVNNKVYGLVRDFPGFVTFSNHKGKCVYFERDVLQPIAEAQKEKLYPRYLPVKEAGAEPKGPNFMPPQRSHDPAIIEAASTLSEKTDAILAALAELRAEIIKPKPEPEWKAAASNSDIFNGEAIVPIFKPELLPEVDEAYSEIQEFLKNCSKDKIHTIISALIAHERYDNADSH